MKKILLISISIIALSSCQEQKKDTTTGTTEKTTLETNLARAKSKYVCPMKECKNGHSDQEGNCPDCGMKLVLNKDYVAPDTTVHP